MYLEESIKIHESHEQVERRNRQTQRDFITPASKEINNKNTSKIYEQN